MLTVNKRFVEQKNFPDGTLLMKFKPDYVSCQELRITWNYESDAELFSLICLVNKIREHGHCGELVLFMPYIPHARFDRTEKNDDVFTLKYFAKVINSLNFTKVEVLDAHSNVSLALIDRVDEHELEPYLSLGIDNLDVKSENTVLCFPDAGAQKRYKSLLRNGFYNHFSSKSYKDYNIPYVVGNKVRDWSTGQILSYEICGNVDLTGKDVVIVDDICSRGGTFVACTEALVKKGANSVSLYVTHCENNVLKGKLFDNDKFRMLVTTDSLVHSDEFINNDKIKIINVK